MGDDELLTPAENMLTAKQVAERLNVTPKHVRSLFSKGFMTTVNVGAGTKRRRLRVTEAELARFIETGAKPAATVEQPKPFTRQRRKKFVPKFLKLTGK